MIILKILVCILILVLAPACMGMLVVNSLTKENRTLGLAIPAGYLIMMISFEIVTVPILLTTSYKNFVYVCWIYTPVMLVLMALGIYSTVCRLKKENSSLKNMLSEGKACYSNTSLESRIVWMIAGVILICILVLMETRVIFDGDDAYYVVQSLISQQNGTMYVIQPYTGRAAALDVRHALAVFTMWISYVGKLSGIHTTILCHTVLPLVIIPLTLLTYTELGLRLIGEKKELVPYFTVFMELLILFGRVSIYTPETFLISRTWQGKSMAANLLIPLTMLGLLIMYMTYTRSSEKVTWKNAWVMVLLANTAAGIFSSLAVMLVSVLIMVGAFAMTVYKRKINILINAIICCIPGGLYILVYLYYTYFGWK